MESIQKVEWEREKEEQLKTKQKKMDEVREEKRKKSGNKMVNSVNEMENKMGRVLEEFEAINNSMGDIINR